MIRCIDSIDSYNRNSEVGSVGVGAGLHMYDVVVKKFSLAISSPDMSSCINLGAPSGPIRYECGLGLWRLLLSLSAVGCLALPLGTDGVTVTASDWIANPVPL